MAQSILQLFPNAKLTIGPPIENGFYYDIDFGDEKFTEADLERVEAQMAKNAEANYPIVREELSREDAHKRIEALDQAPYKFELLDDIPEGDVISFYTQGDFTDLCRGPHVASTGEILHYKLLNIAGAYWRGSEKNKMLTRVYGTAFETQEELDQHGRDAGDRPKGTLGQIRPLGNLRRENVSRDGRWRASVRAKADELPVPYRDVRLANAELSRPADSICRIRHGVPV